MINQSNHPAVELSDLAYRYAIAGPIAVAVDRLIVESGEQIVITGASGGGKSTLLHLIAGLMEPSQGEIRVAGTSINGLRGSKRDRFRGQHIGMVFQTHQLLLGFSVLENVLAALMFSQIKKSQRKARALALLEELGINAPNARIDELSLGQQQRVAVARAIACSPTIVLADEPTSALDPSIASTAMDLLQNACRSNNAALICVTHDHTLVDRFDQHHRLEDLASDRAKPAGANTCP